MPVPDHFIPVLKDLVHDLVLGNFTHLEADGRAGRLTAEELRRAISQYGRTLIDPPNESFEKADLHPIEGQSTDSWGVDLDLWTAEEGQSDLTLSLTLQALHDTIIARIDDLHVL